MYSCTSSPTKNKMTGAEEIVIDAQNQNALSLDSLIKKVEFIKLETINDNFVGIISQILITDSFIVVVDGRYAKVIRVFDINGKYKNSIGSIGRGPGEYVGIISVCLSHDKKRVVIHDTMQQKIIYYKLNGEYEHSENQAILCNKFEYFPDGNKAYHTGSWGAIELGQYKDSALVVTNNKDSILYGACYEFYKDGQFAYKMKQSLWRFQDEIYFSPGFSRTIYQVTDSMVIPKYQITIVSNAMPELDNRITSDQFSKYCREYYYFNGDMIELKDLTHINISTPSGYPFVVYSHSKKQTFFSTDQGSHPLFPFLKGLAPHARYGDNAVVFTVSAYHLMINKEEWYKYEPDRQFLEDLYGDLTIDSNPVLVICHLNERIGYEE
ncbi:MAG: hypothetical protein BGO29_01265 [Bacteroidales bacterium 36-12]|nr:MAG: hypothetical protein BGO29_01265 [Bacteroidales bacterium 36-12]